MKKHKKTSLNLLSILSVLILFMISCQKDDNSKIVYDIDGNIYHSVTIGTQVWMAENLKVTHYRNGDSLPNIKNDSIWCWATFTGAYCNYSNDDANANIYGRLYNMQAVNDTRILAPVGWHIATESDWKILIDYMNGDSIAGGSLKESGTSHWISPNTGATNLSGFNALPGGYRYDLGGYFAGMGKYGFWWGSTNYFIRLSNESKSTLTFHSAYGRLGLSVRCVKD
jgi:uncharacterized protein (TIGR02145 family)